MDQIIPINPYPGAKKSKKTEFWTDLVSLFMGVDDPVGAVMAVTLAIGFVFKWGFFLLGKVLGLKLTKPKVKKKQ